MPSHFALVLKNIAGGKSGVSSGEAAAVNGVWPREGSLSSRAWCHAKEAKPPPGPGHAVSRENRMTLPGHLAGGRAERKRERCRACRFCYLMVG